MKKILKENGIFIEVAVKIHHYCQHVLVCTNLLYNKIHIFYIWFANTFASHFVNAQTNNKRKKKNKLTKCNNNNNKNNSK